MNMFSRPVRRPGRSNKKDRGPGRSNNEGWSNKEVRGGGEQILFLIDVAGVLTSDTTQ